MTLPGYFTEFFSAPRVLLAPLAGISDVAFRSLCVEQGADLTFTEMVSAKGLSYGNERTFDLLALAPNEVRVSPQLFGHEPGVLADQARMVSEALGERLFAVDINMGCPARKIVSKGDGSALMKDPRLAGDIVAAIRRAVDVPITIKFRRGWAEEESCVEFARIMEAAGADALTVHGRFAMQYYQGSACWESIARVKEAVCIPVVGNGDIKNGEDALRMIGETHCDAVMIGRAAEGNPWVFSQVKAALRGETNTDAFLPTVPERMAMACRHAALACEEPGGAVRMRRQAMCYVSGIPGATAARQALCACSRYEDFERVFTEVAERASRPL